MESHSDIVYHAEVTAEAVIAAFDGWLTAQLGDAYSAGMDLCFCDRPSSSDDPQAVGGWDHRLLKPGAEPPPGCDWTVYRLHDERR